jgi:hypothetical protein
MNNTQVPIIRVDYDEPDPNTYRGVTIGHTLWNSGDPTIDFICAVKLAWLFREDGADFVMCSSSVNHFVMDGGELDDSGDWTEEQTQAATALLVQQANTLYGRRFTLPPLPEGEE